VSRKDTPVPSPAQPSPKKSTKSIEQNRKFLHYLKERAGKRLRRRIAQGCDLQMIATFIRSQVLNNRRHADDRRKRGKLHRQRLVDARRAAVSAAAYFRASRQEEAAAQWDRKIPAIDEEMTRLKEAFDAQRLGRSMNYLPLMTLKTILSVSGEELGPREMADLLEAGYYAWGREKYVDPETLGKALKHFEKRNPAMMAEIRHRFGLS
jgi:hypothetical protein